MGEFEAKRCRGKSARALTFARLGLSSSIATAKTPRGKVCCHHTKAHYCLLAGDVPLASPDSLPIFLLPIAGIIQLTSKKCINRPTFPVVSGWVGPMVVSARDGREKDSEGRVLIPFAFPVGGLAEGCILVQFLAPIRQASLHSPLSLSILVTAPSSCSIRPKMGNYALLALSNYTFLCGFSIPCP